MSALVASSACGDDDSKEPFRYVEPAAEQIVFTQSNLVYYGAEVSDNSDLWELILMTEDVTVDDAGFPVGPGCFMQLAFNTAPSEELDPNKLVGTYNSASSTGDFSVGTFLWGDIARIDLPTGIVEMPINSFFCELAAGSSELVPDLLNEKGFTIARNGDGTFEIRGTLVGTSYLQRNFTFRGALEAIDPQRGAAASDHADGRSATRRCGAFHADASGERQAVVRICRHQRLPGHSGRSGRRPRRPLPPFGRGRMLQLDLMVDLSASRSGRCSRGRVRAAAQRCRYDGLLPRGSGSFPRASGYRGSSPSRPAAGTVA